MSVDPQATPDTGNSADPQTDPQDTQDTTDWKQRFQDTQAAFTKSQQELQRLVNGDDPDRFQELMDRYGYETEPDEPEPAYQPDATTTVDPRLEQVPELQRQIEALTAAQNQRQFNADLQETVGDRELPQVGRDWVEVQTINNGGNREALNAAVKQWFEFQDGLVASHAPKSRPRAPHVPAGGETPSSGARDTAEMSIPELTAHMVEQLRANEAQ
jgi:hypothetical protein